MKRKILFILFCICSFSSMVASKRTGAQDRELWVKYLCRIASPVIDNLAKGTLEANMPVETGKNFYGNPRDVTYLEAVGRTLAGIAPWLALPDDNTEEGKLRKSFRTSRTEKWCFSRISRLSELYPQLSAHCRCSLFSTSFSTCPQGFMGATGYAHQTKICDRI